MVLPAPVAPTSATRSPDVTVNEQSRSTQSSSAYANQTSRNSTAARGGAPSGRRGIRPAPGFRMAGSTSSSPKIRSEEAMAACMTAYFAPRSRMGRKNRFVYSMNATSPPKVSIPRQIWPPPYQRSSATAAEPMASTEA